MYSNLNWKDLQEMLREGNLVVILPTGATEPHGPHCPLGTDTIISLEACLRAAQRLHARGYKAFVLPPLSYSVTEVSRNFPGRISITQKTDAAIISEICTSLINQGISRICLFNHHLEPGHVEAVRGAVEEVEGKTGVKIAFVDIARRKYVVRLTEAFQKAETHADRHETSVVLAVDPLLVNEERRKGLKYLPINLVHKMYYEHLDEFKAMGMTEAYCGDPASASAKEGEEILKVLSDFIVEDIEDMFEKAHIDKPEKGC